MPRQQRAGEVISKSRNDTVTCQERRFASLQLQAVHADKGPQLGAPTGRPAWTHKPRNNCRGGGGRVTTDGHVPGQRDGAGGRVRGLDDVEVGSLLTILYSSHTVSRL